MARTKSNAEIANLVRSLFEATRKRKELERKEEELKTVLEQEMGLGVFPFGSYRLNITEGSRDIVDVEKLIAELGEDKVNKLRKTSTYTQVTATRKTEEKPS